MEKLQEVVQLQEVGGIDAEYGLPDPSDEKARKLSQLNLLVEAKQEVINILSDALTLNRYAHHEGARHYLYHEMVKLVNQLKDELDEIELRLAIAGLFRICGDNKRLAINVLKGMGNNK